MKRVYVAGAYSANNVLTLLNNIRKGIRWSLKVFLRGYAPFSPWLDFQFHLLLREEEHEDLAVQDYYDYSMAFLDVCEVVFVTPGWEESKGTIAEIKRAEELGIPVIYDIEELPPLR